MLYGFTISNFRNFGAEEQWFSPLSRVNVLIGSNNSGKSNVLRYIKRIVAPTFEPSRTNAIEQRAIDKSITGSNVSSVEFRAPFPPKILPGDQWEPGWTSAFERLGMLEASKEFIRLCISTGALSHDRRFAGSAELADHSVQQAFQRIWHLSTRTSGGGFNEHWFPEVMNKIIQTSTPTVDPYYVPSFRQIPTRMEEFKDEFAPHQSGDHIIDKLAALAYPSYSEQKKKQEFERLRRFIGAIIGDDDVKVEIPNDKQTINVSTKGRFLPIEALGSGVHEVFMLASEIVVRPNQTILLEEPEVHLHPTLQRRFMQFVMEETENQIFITTHSATIIDTPGAQIFEVRHEDEALLRPITTSQGRFAACRELGFRASDLVQTNCVVWVEGPSDRIYLLYWLSERATDLKEGVHFSIMFYGGKLLSHLSADEESVADFIQLLPICRHPAILIDSDKSGGASRIRDTKLRIEREFKSLNALCWITSGREIENYYSRADRDAAVKASHKNVAKLVGGPTRYDKPITFLRSGSDKECVADKIAVANYLTANAAVTVESEEFESSIAELIKYIRKANQ